MRRLISFVVAGCLLGLFAAYLTGSEPRLPDSRDGAHLNHRLSSNPAPNSTLVRPALRAAPLQRTLEPTDSRYDPVELHRESGAELLLEEIFEREPRDPAFAHVLEKRVSVAVDEIVTALDLSEVIRKVNVECRTLSCFTSIEVEKKDVTRVYDLMNGILLGDVQSPSFAHGADGSTHLGQVTFYNLYRPERRDESNHQEFLEKAMRPVLEYVREQERKAEDEARH